MLQVRDLTVRRGSTTIVRGLDWTVAPGGPAWVVGPNGAGKSTLLRTLAGLYAPAGGRIHLGEAGGRPLYFHAETALPPEATVGDWERLAGKLLERAGAGPRTPLWPEVPGRRRVGRLSTGERKRLLLDILLRQSGRMLLLDEPYEHLSPDAKTALTGILTERARSAVVVVATNQLPGSAERRGLRLEAGAAVLLEAPEP